MLWDTIFLALREIRRNVMRSFLTILGIVIGVASVITMVTLGSGATVQVTEQIASLGSNLLMVTPGQRMGPGQAVAAPFRLKDAEAIAREVPSVAAVAPASSQAVTAILGNENWTTTATGTNDQYLQVRSWSLKEGRLFSDSELRAGASVCILGDTVRQKLFGGLDPIGSRIRLGKLSFQVIGLLEAKGQSGMGRDQDDIVLMPLQTFQRRISGNQYVSLIQVSVRDGASTEKAQRDIERLMRERRHIAPNADDDFSVMDMKEITKMLTGTTQVLTGLLGAVAAVSLLVGGIGIMNIMLVSVTERTREIGIRKAIGAKKGVILWQFLVESMFISSIGVILGLGISILLAMAIKKASPIPVDISAWVAFLGIGFTVSIGVFFGIYPASKAARLDPIEALRYE